MTHDLTLAHGFCFRDLYDRGGLVALDARFVEWLKARDVELHNRLMAGRADPGALDALSASTLVIDLAPHLEAFLAELFGIEDELAALARRHASLSPLYACKRLFVQRVALKKISCAETEAFDGAALWAEIEGRLGAPFSEEAFAEAVMGWLDDEAAFGEELDAARRFAAWAARADAPRAAALRKGGVLFTTPAKLDFEHLVPVETVEIDGVTMMRLPKQDWRHREGFSLTDRGCGLKGALDQANYCILCHNQGKDSCSKGLRDKKTGAFRKSPFGVTLAGCPLAEKISEMHTVKAQGHAIGALAVITIDNPMVAATGHRICNDCMKSCIYQKQDPVDIPQAETRTLKDVLDLPWGFEIYSLLTRWNPLNLARPIPRPDSGYKVLAAGLGPAGFTLAHHLLNDGHTVVAVDGLKIEPLPAEISGVDERGAKAPFAPIRDVTRLYENLNDRVMAGFGGVAEYGITVRWNKNFLKLIRLLLERRAGFAMFGGVRFGGTVTADEAFEAGFDHIALALGAGRPTVIAMKDGLARGVREASDFLMALQLTGAAKATSIANLQLRLPVVVIGGGLTAIDTATEALAYYPVQVEKFLKRYETLVAERGEEAVSAAWSEEEAAIADEFIAHARAIRRERHHARAEGREPRLAELVDDWGGVTIAYRKRLIDAPSYTLNHEEVAKAMEEGIRFAECLSPTEIETDRFGHASAIKLVRQHLGEDGRWRAGDESVRLDARAVLIAAGTSPNTVLHREDPGNFEIDGRFFQALGEDGTPVSPQRVSKPDQVQVLVHKRDDGRAISFFGDLHPSFAGNVVKAMGSAKQGFPVVSRVLSRRPPALGTDGADFIAGLNSQWRATVHEVKRLTPTIVEVVVRAPAAARRFRPGQFFRLQNYEQLAPRAADGDTVLAAEGLALTGAWVDAERGFVSTIVLEMGGSSDICALLRPGEPVVLMGPTGAPTEIPSGETVLLAGGGLGNAVLFSIGQAMRARGCRVLYFAGYKTLADRYKVDQIERAADVVVWTSDEAPGFTPDRPGDKCFVGNIVEAMAAYGGGALGETTIALSDVDRVMAIGSDRMMAAVAAARHGVLEPLLKHSHIAIGSINSPMQCMMKEICAQCLQPHKDPVTGEETVVFSCFNQDQPLDLVDFDQLNARLRQNAVQEKLTRQWIDRCLRGLKLRENGP